MLPKIERENYTENPENPVCKNCIYFKFDLRPGKYHPTIHKENKRCALDELPVKMNASCDTFLLKDHFKRNPEGMLQEGDWFKGKFEEYRVLLNREDSLDRSKRFDFAKECEEAGGMIYSTIEGLMPLNDIGINEFSSEDFYTRAYNTFNS